MNLVSRTSSTVASQAAARLEVVLDESVIRLESINIREGRTDREKRSCKCDAAFNGDWCVFALRHGSVIQSDEVVTEQAIRKARLVGDILIAIRPCQLHLQGVFCAANLTTAKCTVQSMSRLRA